MSPAAAKEHGSGLGRWRWVVDRAFAWLHDFRGLRIRWERDPVIDIAFLTLVYAVICWRYLAGLCNRFLATSFSDHARRKDDRVATTG